MIPGSLPCGCARLLPPALLDVGRHSVWPELKVGAHGVDNRVHLPLGREEQHRPAATQHTRSSDIRSKRISLAELMYEALPITLRRRCVLVKME
eukprot:1790603-Pleurochrysis_carterae.AAC.2